MGDGRNEDAAVLSDPCLVDVRGLNPSALNDAFHQAVLGRALDRILADKGDIYNGFNNSI
jgi:FXSXX-COOH protein